MNSAELGVAVRERARELGFDLVGFGRATAFEPERELILEHLANGYLEGMAWITPERVELSCDPERLLPGVRTIIGLGTSYAQELPVTPLLGEVGRRREALSPGEGEPPHSSDSPSAQPSPRGRGSLTGRVARYAWGRDYHHVIPPRLKALAENLAELAGPATRSRTFVDTGPLVDRAAAVRTGLGFVGKNTCLLTGPLGSYVFLSAVLTTAEITPDPMLTKNCGSCTACIDACPTDALVGPEVIDATRCISYLTIEHRGSIPRDLRPLMGDWVFGCDICQEVCPWNQARVWSRRVGRDVQKPQEDGPGSDGGLGSTRGSVRGWEAHAEFAPSEGAGAELDLTELLALDDAGFRARFNGTPLTRAKRRGLLRNAAVALGNRGDVRAVPTLLRALADPEPLVREHAAWALGRLGPLSAEVLEALRRALTEESEIAVRAEIEAALT